MSRADAPAPPAAPPPARPPAVIAIDGPAASGKSTTARAVAIALDFRHADSGAFYRAITAARLRTDRDDATWTEDSLLAAAASVSARPVDGTFAVLVHGQDAGDELRSIDVTSRVSRVARMPRVRAWVNDAVRACARDGPIVVDGRDMGTAVFPDATLKVWLVADVPERARRRSVEMLGRLPTDDELARESEALTTRDARDATQTQPAADAVRLDTTRLSREEQVAAIVAMARERLK